MRIFRKILIALIIIFLVFGGALYFLTNGDSVNLVKNDIGSVDKIYYGDKSSNIKIGIISGMHSREKLHLTVLPQVSKIFPIFNKVIIVNYNVIVTDSPEDFYKGRANGESLVHDYVVPDINKENFDLVIIGHDHEIGYGEGFYLATPSMDSDSVDLANRTCKELGNFNYYPRNTSFEAKSTSITTVDNPIVENGTKLFVYEIPENESQFKAFNESYRLIEKAYKLLSS